MKKELISCHTSFNNFTAYMYKNLRIDDEDLDVKFEEAVNDPDAYEFEVFDNFYAAEDYAINFIEENDDYYYALISYDRFTFDEDMDDCIGDCEESIIVAEYWAELPDYVS